MKTYSMLINGSYTSGNGQDYFQRLNPYNARPFGRYPAATIADVDQAAKAARAAFEAGWASVGAGERSKLLLKGAIGIELARSSLASVLAEETGKPLQFGLAEVDLLVDFIRQAAAECRTLDGRTVSNEGSGGIAWTMQDPIGVVVAITPYNFPLFAFGAKVPFALAAGCTVITKPSPYASGVTLEVARLLNECGLPPGVLNVVTTAESAVSEALVTHPLVDKITFTGSTPVGKNIMRAAADRMSRVTLELGGKSPNIVFADADLDAVSDAAFYSIFMNAGQICTAGSRLLVHESIHDEIVDRFVSAARGARLGNPMDESCTLGPLVSGEQRSRVHDFVAGAVAEGAQLACGGLAPTDEGLRDGFFFTPTVLTAVEPGMRVAREEVFGPVLAVIPFTSDDEAIRIANATDFGLKAGVWTQDVDRMFRVARRIRAGTVMGNTYRASVPQGRMPFGGYKHSGVGREFGPEGLHDFLETKTMFLKVK